MLEIGIILGIHYKDTRRRLLSTKDLTLEKTISICRSEETATLTIRDIQKQASDVHRIEKKAQHSVRTIACKYCGKTHQRKKEICPAWGTRCKSCGKNNNFASKCMRKPKKSHQIEDARDSDLAESIEHIDIEAIDQLEHQVHVIKNTKVYADTIVKSTGKKVSFHTDSSLSVNIFNACPSTT